MPLTGTSSKTVAGP